MSEEAPDPYKAPKALAKKLALLAEFLETHYYDKGYTIEVQKGYRVDGLPIPPTRIRVVVNYIDYMNCDLEAFDKWIEREITN